MSAFLKEQINFFVFLAALSFVLMVFIGWETGAIYEFATPIESARQGAASPSYSHVRQAVSLLDTGTFNNNTHGYIGMHRGPVYPAMLAITFAIFGRVVGAIYIVNVIFLILAVLFTWKVSLFFLSGKWRYVPAAMVALYWGIVSQVWVANYETLALFLSTFAIFCLLKYRYTQKPLFLALSSISFSLWALEKPAALYFLPIATLFVIFWNRGKLSRIKKAGHILLFVSIALSIVGAWAHRNSRAIDTWQIGSGGHTLLRRASQMEYSRRDIAHLAVSVSVGDIFGKLFLDGYSQHSSPPAWDPKIDDRWYQPGWMINDLDGEVITKTELDTRMYSEALPIIREHPFKFLVTGVVGLLRLNAPLNHRGQEVMRLFAEEDGPMLPPKALFVFALRFIWYAFLAIILYGLMRRGDETPWAILLALLIYYNMSHALLTHAEARYAMVILPMYFIFFTEGARLLIQKYAK